MNNVWECLKETVRDETKALDVLVAETLNARAASGRRTYCTSGCSHCCTLYVQATLVEALIVAEELSVGQLRRLDAYIERQRESFAGESDFLALLHRQRATLGPCPFLDDNGCCAIYANRPLACRALLSTKDPEWCGVDFSTLDPLEKRLYLESLERPVVAFPVHYLAGTQNAAKVAEERIMVQMNQRLGGSISGNFPLLVHLASRHDFNAQIATGVVSWQRQWRENSLFHPLLLHIQPATAT